MPRPAQSVRSHSTLIYAEPDAHRGIGSQRGLGGDAHLEVTGGGGGDASVGIVPEHAHTGTDGQRRFLGEVKDALGLCLDHGILHAIHGGHAEQRTDQHALTRTDTMAVKAPPWTFGITPDFY